MPYPLKIRILGGPILSSQRIKIDLEGGQTFGDLYYHIRRQMPKILSEEQALNTLAVTPENYDLVFVDVQEGRARPMETCDPSMRIQDANWVCPALMLRVRDNAIRSVVRAQTEKNLVQARQPSSGSYDQASTPQQPLSSSIGSVKSKAALRQSVSFAQMPTTDDSGLADSGNFGRRETSTNGGGGGLHRQQSTYMWSDNVERPAGVTAVASGSLPSTPSALQRNNLNSAESNDQPMTRSTVSPAASDLMQALTQRHQAEASGPNLTEWIASPEPRSVLKSPMRSSIRRINSMAQSSFQDFGDVEESSVNLGRKQSSLTARSIQDLPSGTLPASASPLPRYAHDPAALNYRDRLMAILAMYDPKALRKIDRILAKSQGKEEQLLQLAILKYGPEPKYTAGPTGLPRAPSSAALAQTLSGTFSSNSDVNGGVSAFRRIASIGEETLRRATQTHANSVVQIDDDGIVSYKSEFRNLVEYLFEEYDFLTPTAVSLFLQRIQGNPRPLAANLALHMQLYKYLRLNLERADQLRRRVVERELFTEHHAAHQLTRMHMWFDICCSIERKRFEGMHLILRSAIPPQFFLGWLYLQRQESYAWETVMRLDWERKQLVWFHSFQRTFYVERETVLRRAMLVSQRAESHHLQRFCYADRQTVRRRAREAEEYRCRCHLEQWKLIERERHARLVHCTEVLEALHRRCLMFGYTSTAFDVPLGAQCFFEKSYRAVYELNEIEGRMRVVQCIQQRRAWILLEQLYTLATEQALRHQYEWLRGLYIEKRHQQFYFGLEEADKRTLAVHFEMGCRWRILQRRWMHRETVVRNQKMREYWRERCDIEGEALLSRENATRRTLKRTEQTQQVQVRMEKMTREEEPEGRWFHIFGESATFRHHQRQYRFFLETAARRDLQLYGLCKLMWLLESKRRGDIELREQEAVISMTSGSGGSMEAVRRQAIVLDALRGLFMLFQRAIEAHEDRIRNVIVPLEHDARQRIFRRGVYEGEDQGRHLVVRAQEWVARETLMRWNHYRKESIHRTFYIYNYHHLSLHAVTARGYIRCRESRERISEIREPLERGGVAIDERLDRDALEIKQLVGLEDVKRKLIIRQEKSASRIALYREEKHDRDLVERFELNDEEHDRRIYWRIFELFTWERIPRLHLQYGHERKLRSMMERNFLTGVESISRDRIRKVEYTRGFHVLEQRKLMDRERIIRVYKLQPTFLKELQVFDRKNLVGTEEISRMQVLDSYDKATHIYEQRALQLFYFVVRSHVRQDEYVARKQVEQERLVDQEVSSRRKLRNAALASLQKWWQKTNLQARQDVVAYANRLQREDDNRIAREGAQKRVEERLAARAAEKARASADAKRNQIIGIVVSDEMHARSAIWEEERTEMLQQLHELSEAVHATAEMMPTYVKSKQKLLKALQTASKSTRTQPSLEQFVSLLPPLPKRKRSSASPESSGLMMDSSINGRGVVSETDDDDLVEGKRFSSGLEDLNDMESQMQALEDDTSPAKEWEGADASDTRGFTRGMSMVLPPLNRSASMVGPVASALSPTRVARGGNSGADTVPSELYEQSPMVRPGLAELRGSSGAAGGRNRNSVVSFPPASPSVSVGQVRFSMTSPTPSNNDSVVLPPI